jgi:hypothetical protein
VKYYHSAQAKRDPWELREARVRADIEAIMTIYEPIEPLVVLPKIIEVFVRMIVGEKPNSESSSE